MENCTHNYFIQYCRKEIVQKLDIDKIVRYKTPNFKIFKRKNIILVFLFNSVTKYFIGIIPSK